MMSRIRLAGFAFCLALTFASSRAADAPLSGYAVIPGRPDAFPLGFAPLDDSHSPNGRYAVIAAKAHALEEDDEIFVVERKPFRVVCSVEGATYDPTVSRYGEVNALWAKDSSAVVVMVKWKTRRDDAGLESLIVIELKAGRALRATNLLEDAARFCDPAKTFENGLTGDFADDGKAPNCRLDAHLQVHLDCIYSEKSLRFQGVWSIPQQKWISRKTTKA